MDSQPNSNDDDDCVYANNPITELANITQILKTTEIEELLKSDKAEIEKADKPICWYHGKINRIHAERILGEKLQTTKKCSGAIFLVRGSSVSDNDFVISAVCQDQFYHFQIIEKFEGYYYMDGTKTIQGLDELIKKLQSKDVLIPIVPTDFCEGHPPPHRSRRFGRNNVLHRAIWEGCDKTVGIILSNALCPDINAKNEFGSTALHDACFYGFDRIPELLVDADADVHSLDSNGETPLHRACAANRVSAVQVLMTQGSADPMKRTPQNRWTPLHNAAAYGHVDCVRTLIVDFQVPCFPRDEEGFTPLDIAEKYGKDECCELLMKFNARPSTINRSDWYHPEVDREGATKLFESNGIRDGLFLVRKSTRDKSMNVISLCHNKSMYNYEIKECHYREKYVYYVDDGPYLPSLEHLVQHYSRHPDGLPSALMLSVSTSGELKMTEEEEDYMNLSVTSKNNTSKKVDRPSLPPRPSSLSHDDHSQQNTPPPLPSQPPPLTMEHRKSTLKIIDEKHLSQGKKIGEGEFGSVLKGEYYPEGKKKNKIPVAIKTFHPDQLNNKEDFLREAAFMNGLDHHCVLKLIGVCEKPLLLVEEYVSKGSMLDYLLDYPEKISVKDDMYLWAGQIAYGMMYLEKMKMVHRDLAARNILIEDKKQVKISDFGLSRAVGVDSNYYKASCGGKWPIKWYAPECVNFGKFTHASDVWSFGVTLWEMFSFGDPPYGDSKGIEVIQLIENGSRLQKPEKCPKITYKKMLETWNLKAKDRPTFKELHHHFSNDPEYGEIGPLVMKSKKS